jgi:hypothetical protein
MRSRRQKRSFEKHVLRRRNESFISNVSLMLRRGVWREKEKADKVAERQRQKEEKNSAQALKIILKEEETSLKTSLIHGQTPETCR